MGIIEIKTDRYWELLEKEENSKREGLNLTGQESMELLDYRVKLGAICCFNHREKYMEFIQAYLADDIEALSIGGLFDELGFMDMGSRRSLEKELRKNGVSTLLLDSRAERFSSLLNHLWGWDEGADSLLDEYNGNEELAEEKYRVGVEKIYLEMKELLEED